MAFSGQKPVLNRRRLLAAALMPRRAAGYTGHKPPWDAFWGQRYAVVADPDGNLIDLFAYNS